MIPQSLPFIDYMVMQILQICMFLHVLQNLRMKCKFEKVIDIFFLKDHVLHSLNFYTIFNICTLYVQGAEHLSSICLASPLDETLDREVLLLLQGPTPEQMSMEFKMLINRLVISNQAVFTHLSHDMVQYFATKII